VNGVAHLVRRDIAQHGQPAGVWAGVVVATTGLFATVEFEAVGAGTLWADGMALALQLAMLVERLFAALIVALLVLADPPAGDRAFWPTRPIAGGRLLLAKSVSAVALLIALPLAGLVPLWGWVGRGPGVVADAAVGFAGTQGFTIAFAAMVASLTRSLPQTMAVGGGVGVLFALTPALGGALGAEHLLPEARRQRWAAMEAVLLLTTLAVAVQQYRTRCTRRSWAVMVAGLLGAVGVGIGWRGAWSDGTSTVAPNEVTVTLGPLAGNVGGVIPAEGERAERVPTLQVAVAGSGGGGRFLVPLAGRGAWVGADGRAVAVLLVGKAELPAGSALPAWQARAGEPLPWAMRVRRVAPEPAALDAGPLRWSGDLRLAEYVREFVLELPLRAGATAQAGSNRLRVVQLERDLRGEIAACLVEERDLRRALDTTVALGSPLPLDGRSGVLEAYVLRSASGERVLSVDQRGAATKHAVVRGLVNVNLPRDLPATERESAVLLKVRFLRGRMLRSATAAAAIEVLNDKEKS
jgi:hypothetical protein